MKDEILNWLRSGQDYDSGVQLYAKYGHNKTLLKNFLRKPTENRKAKLAYKLVTIAKLPEAYITLNVNKLPKGEKLTPNPTITGHTEPVEVFVTKNEAAKQYKGKILFKDLPEEVQLMIVSRSSLEKQRAAKHAELHEVPKSNSRTNKKARRKINHEVAEFNGQINRLNAQIKDYEDNSKLPQDETPGVVEQSLLKIKQTLMNLKSQRSKARAKIFGNEKNDPIPDGPRKEAAKKKLAELEPKITDLEKKLNE